MLEETVDASSCGPRLMLNILWWKSTVGVAKDVISNYTLMEAYQWYKSVKQS